MIGIMCRRDFKGAGDALPWLIADPPFIRLVWWCLPVAVSIQALYGRYPGRLVKAGKGRGCYADNKKEASPLSAMPLSTHKYLFKLASIFNT